VIDEAFLLVEPRARAKGVQLEAKFDGVGSDVIRGDPEKLLQILLNLISNAIKFSDPGGRVSIRCDEVRSDAGSSTVNIEVRDHRRGIPRDKLDDIFEPFFQVEKGLTRNSDGVGLGLAISRTLARAMSGDVTATSEPGKGSAFVVSVLTSDPQTVQ
jgi:signal transduction histidine kinase